jgi:hypothetical protein
VIKYCLRGVLPLDILNSVDEAQEFNQIPSITDIKSGVHAKLTLARVLL